MTQCNQNLNKIKPEIPKYLKQNIFHHLLICKTDNTATEKNMVTHIEATCLTYITYISKSEGNSRPISLMIQQVTQLVFE